MQCHSLFFAKQFAMTDTIAFFKLYHYKKKHSCFWLHTFYQFKVCLDHIDVSFWNYFSPPPLTIGVFIFWPFVVHTSCSRKSTRLDIARIYYIYIILYYLIYSLYYILTSKTKTHSLASAISLWILRRKRE